jgi:hypothetical protein
MVTAVLYEHFGRSTAYTVCAVVMLLLVATGSWLARSEWSMKRPLHVAEADPVAIDASIDR